MHVHLGVPMAAVWPLQIPSRLFATLSIPERFVGVLAGKATGLLPYRPTIFGTVPRGGLPPLLSEKQFRGLSRYALRRVEEQGEIIQAHWFLRPSAFWPTVEVRIMDMCPDADDALAIVALIACLSTVYLSDPQGWQGDSGGSLAEPLPLFVSTPQHLLAESVWRVREAWSESRNSWRGGRGNPRFPAQRGFAAHFGRPFSERERNWAATMSCSTFTRFWAGGRAASGRWTAARESLRLRRDRGCGGGVAKRLARLWIRYRTAAVTCGDLCEPARRSVVRMRQGRSRHIWHKRRVFSASKPLPPDAEQH